MTRAVTAYTCRGQAILAILLVMLMAGISVAAVFARPSALQIKEIEATAEHMASAKAALIGRAARTDARPGSMPCPDLNGDGSAELMIGSNCPSYIGWLPWRTLGLPVPAQYGEPLWYALSNAYRPNANPAPPPLNSDTGGTLSLDSAGDIAAVVLAPGAIVNGQIRGTPVNPDLRHYLEGGNADGDSRFVTRDASPFNDRALAISRAEVMAVADRRVVSEVRQALNDYRATAGEYPPDLALAIPPGASFDWYRRNRWDMVIHYVREAPDRAKLTLAGTTYPVPAP